MDMQSTRFEEGGAGEARLARGLGWFSIGLGLAEAAAPDALASLIGVRPTDGARKTLRLFGARELANGVAILSRPRRPVRVWSRVIGDAIDLTALALAMRQKRCKRDRLTMAMAAVLGVGVLDALAGRSLSSAIQPRTPTMSITINRPPAEVYAYWSSLEDVDVSNVTFTLAPDGIGTEVRVEMPSTGKLGAWFGKLFGGKQPTMKDLRQLKQVIETGEVVYSDTSIHRGMHAAQPSGEEGIEP